MNDDQSRFAQRVLAALIVVLTVLALVRCARAQQPPIDLATEWSESTQTLLAAAVVGESGWNATVDHAAIPWRLHARWRAVGGTFEEVILRYCRALSGKRPWLLQLNAQGTRPSGWPANARWSKHKAKWLKIHARIGAWARGEVPDPCPTAVHFGGGMDPPQGTMVPAVCIGSVSRFWAVPKG